MQTRLQRIEKRNFFPVSGDIGHCEGWRIRILVGPINASGMPEATLAKQRYDNAIDTEVAIIPYDSTLNSLLNHPLRINTRDLGRHYPPFSIDLNQDSEIVLAMVFKDMVAHYEEVGLAGRVDGFKGAEEFQAKAVILRREALHNLSSLADLDEAVDDDLLAIFRANLLL